MDALGIDAAAVVGNSMGGFIAAELAIAFPQRVERLVLVSPAGISTSATTRVSACALLLRWCAARADDGRRGWTAAHADAVARRPAAARAAP